jgi:predicted nucleic acid-binding protein
MTASLALIDTSILVCAFDAGSDRKVSIAKELVGRSWKGEARYAISSQNLAEFSVVVREKIANPVPTDEVRQILELIMRSRNWEVLTYDAKTVIRAHGIRDEFHLHFWDALLAATMEENLVRTIVTEDAHFRNIPWVTVRNPF